MSEKDERKYTSDIAFTPAVKAMQEQLGSRKGYARMEASGGWKDRVTPDLADFVAARDSFYLATANADGQPYIQHRGGKPGFLKVIDERTLGFADYSGNRQYITAGTLTENDKAFIFLMDYPNRRRIKLWGRARTAPAVGEIRAKVADPDEPVAIERVILFEIEAWDVNSPKFIEPRFTEAELAPALKPVNDRIAALEAENERLKSEIATLKNPQNLIGHNLDF
jgi:predicted pyridoxine 5'-phosphate oxidase superfamily flavin-nucleotide-binding protein